MNLHRRAFMALAAAAPLAGPSLLRAAPGAGELRDDIAILRRALALHPGLLRYLTPAALDQHLAELERRFPAAPDLQSQFLLLAGFLARVRCGHTQCNPYNQSKAVVAGLFNRPTRLPFAFTWIGGRMIVLPGEGGSAGLAPGTEITAINGEPAPRLLARLLAYARADGHNDGKRIAQMAMRNTERFETFDLFQGLLQPPRDGAFTLRFRTPQGRRGHTEVAALGPEQRAAARHPVETAGTAEPLWRWAMRDGIAVLTMPTWAVYNSRWGWEAWLRDRLDSLAGARGLIIDLRDNEGGNACGNAILARLAPRDLDFAGDRHWVRYRQTPPDLDRYLDTWDPSFRTLGAKGRDLGNGFFDLGTEATDRIVAAPRPLRLKVAALVGPTCSSATFAFARRAQETGLVRLFGEETGGNLRGINGGAFFFVRLPGSGLEFDVPLIGNFPLHPQPDRGVLPDVAIAPRAADIATGTDRCMVAARHWIGSGPAAG